MKPQFTDIIRDSPVPVLVDFFATWCGPCKTLAPMLEKLAKEKGDRLRILKIDVDKNQALAQKLQVQSVPTLILYRQGKVSWRQAGVPDWRMLQSLA